jgi:tetratricopeptide (TPR) repeat protein
MRSRRSPSPPPAALAWWQPALVVCATVVVYANSLHAPFILDDLASIVHNASIREWWRLARVLAPPPELPVSGRPVANISFALTYALAGAAPWAYHACSIALHAICALLLLGIVRRTAERCVGSPVAGRIRAAAWLVALVWAVHPLNSETVVYATQRTELLLGVFYFLTLYAAVRAIDDRGMRWGVVAVAACALGMASKESMASAPAMVLLYDRVFVFESLGQAWRARRRFYAALASTWLVLAACLWTAPRTQSAGFSSGISPVVYLLNQAVMVPHYLRLAVWPRGLVVDYGWPVALAFSQVWPGALVMVGLLLASIVALVKYPRVGFVALWPFVMLAPTSSIVPIATEVGAERRMYLPLAGIVVLAAMALAAASKGSGRREPARGARREPAATFRPAAAAIGLMIAMVLGATTIARNREYLSPLTLATTVVERWPSAVAHATLGEELAAAGRHDEALSELRTAVAGGDFRARYPLGAELFDRGHVEEAAVYLRAFIEEGSGTPALELDARKRLGGAYARQGNWAKAAEQYRQVLADAPDDALAQRYLADVLFAQHAYADAAAEYARYTASRPDDGDALTNLGISLEALGRRAESIDAFRRVARADPRSVAAHVNLAQALARGGSLPEAEAEARAAVALAPQDANVRDLLTSIVAAQHRR